VSEELQLQSGRDPGANALAEGSLLLKAALAARFRRSARWLLASALLAAASIEVWRLSVPTIMPLLRAATWALVAMSAVPRGAASWWRSVTPVASAKGHEVTIRTHLLAGSKLSGAAAEERAAVSKRSLVLFVPALALCPTLLVWSGLSAMDALATGGPVPRSLVWAISVLWLLNAAGMSWLWWSAGRNGVVRLDSRDEFRFAITAGAVVLGDSKSEVQVPGHLLDLSPWDRGGDAG